MESNTLRVLAVEDNPADLRLLKELLGEASPLDFEVVSAETLKEAVLLLRAGGFAVVLLDLNLPDSTGLEGIEKILAAPSAPPVIVLTGLDDQETGLQALSRNAQDYLVKGKFDGDMLVRSIRYAIQRDQAEKALRQNEVLLQAVLDHIPDGIYLKDRDSRLLLANPATLAVIGKPAEAVLGKTDAEYYDDPATGRAIMENDRRIMDTGQMETVEESVFGPEGARVYLSSKAPYYDAEGQIIGLIGTAHEITERVLAEQRIAAHAEELKKANLELQDARRAALNLIEDTLSAQEALQKANAMLRESEQRLSRARDELELRVQERTKELEVTNQELLYEIYEREEAERQLRLQTTAMQAAANGIIITDDEGEILWTNSALTRMTGYTEDELIGRTMSVFKSGQHDQDYYRQMWSTILKGEVWQGETTNRRKDGSLYIEEQTITPVRGEGGQISHFIAIKHDVSEQKQVAAALELERVRLKNILETIPDGVYIVNQGYDIEYVNPVIEKEFGPVASQKCYAYFHDLAEPCPWCRNERVIGGSLLSGERAYARNNKSYEIFEAPLANADGSVSKLKLLHDITQRKQMELDLEQSNRDLQAASSAERKQRQFTEALVAAGLILNRSLKLDEVLALILEQIKAVIPYQFAYIGLLEGESFYDASHAGEADLASTQRSVLKRYSLEEFPLLKKMCQSGQPVFVPDTQLELGWNLVENLEWCRSFLTAPLIIEKQVTGFINLFAISAAFYTREMCDHLVAFAAHASAAIQNAWLFEQVRASSEHLQSLSRRMVEIQESERHYIARELHDEAGQMLTSLMLELHLLKNNASQPEVVIGKIDELENSLDQVQENLHRVAMALRPASLDHLGLVSALRQHVESIGEKHHLKVSFRSEGVEKRLPPNVETVLYRIVQEALTNVVRHAKATQVDVVLMVREAKLIIIIEDDGIGFDPEKVPPGEHLGLFGMRERAEMIDANFVIESTPGKGTTVMVEVGYGDTIVDRG